MTAFDHSYESPKERASLAREAGLGRLSFPSILAGVLVATGPSRYWPACRHSATAIGVNTDLNRNDWATLASAAPSPWTGVLLVAYLFGGYVAGLRMPVGAGLLNGLAVSFWPWWLVAVVGAVAASQTDADASGQPRSLGIPTTGSDCGQGRHHCRIGSLGAMLVGALHVAACSASAGTATDPAGGQRQYARRDGQPAERDQDRPGHDQRDRPRPATRSAPGHPPHQLRHPGGHSRAGQPVTARPLADHTMVRLGRTSGPGAEASRHLHCGLGSSLATPRCNRLRACMASFDKTQSGRPARPATRTNWWNSRPSKELVDASRVDAGDHSGLAFTASWASYCVTHAISGPRR